MCTWFGNNHNWFDHSNILCTPGPNIDDAAGITASASIAIAKPANCTTRSLELTKNSTALESRLLIEHVSLADFFQKCDSIGEYYSIALCC